MMNKDNRNDKIRKIAKKGLTFSLCAVLAGGLAAGSFEGVNKLAGWSGAATVEAASNKDETTLTYAKSEKKDADASDSKSDTSAKVGALALLWAIIVGVPLGCLAAFKRGKLTDSILRVICTLGISMPSFVVASVLLVTLTGDGALNLFPSIFDASQGIRAYILPCFALGFYPMCYTARQTRSAMLDSLSQEYIKTARAKGLKNKKIIFKHALRNALIPVITYLGPQVAFTLCGGFVVESVFSIPGLGRYFVQSIQNRDYPVIMGTTIFLATFIILMNLVVDLLYKVADPRISLTKGGD